MKLKKKQLNSRHVDRPDAGEEAESSTSLSKGSQEETVLQ